MRLEELAKAKTYYCSLNLGLLDQCRYDLKLGLMAVTNCRNYFDQRSLRNFATFVRTIYFTPHGDARFLFLNEQETLAHIGDSPKKILISLQKNWFWNYKGTL